MRFAPTQDNTIQFNAKTILVSGLVAIGVSVGLALLFPSLLDGCKEFLLECEAQGHFCDCHPVGSVVFPTVFVGSFLGMLLILGETTIRS